VSLKAKALRGALWTLVEVLGTQGMAFLVFALLARLLEPRAFGLVALAGTVITVLTIFVEAGFSTAIVRSEEISERKLNTAFWIGVGDAALLVLILSLTAGWVAKLYGAPELAPVLRALSWLMLFGAVSAVHNALLVRRLDFRSKALRRLIAVLAGGAAGVTLALLDFGVWALVGKQAVEGLVDCLVVWRTSPWRPGREISKQDARELFGFGKSMVGSNIVKFINRSADDMIVGVFLGPVALGYYSVAFRANVAVTEVALRATSRTALPVFAKLQGDPARMREAYYQALELAALVACPVFLGLSATAPELCLTVFGADWMPSVRPMQVLGLAGVGLAINLYLGPILIAVGQPNVFFRFSLVQGILNVLSFAIAVRWGIEAVAWAFVARTLIVFPAVLWLLRRAIGAEPRRSLALIGVPTFASLIMLGVVSAARHALVGLPALPLLLALVAVGALTYTALMALLARSTMSRLISTLRAARPMRPAGT
jgi:O-antigen/teichoic acid export membrane protein